MLNRKMLLDIAHTQDMTCEDIAKAMGKSPVTISRWLNGKKSLTIEDMKSLCAVLNITDLNIINNIFLA